MQTHLERDDSPSSEPVSPPWLRRASRFMVAFDSLDDSKSSYCHDLRTLRHAQSQETHNGNDRDIQTQRLGHKRSNRHNLTLTDTNTRNHTITHLPHSVLQDSTPVARYYRQSLLQCQQGEDGIKLFAGVPHLPRSMQ
jgi:hypothetical protein